jgi:hypothetical protein
MTSLDPKSESDVEKKEISTGHLKQVWLTVLILLIGGCVSVILITVLISLVLGLPLHLP